MLCGYAWCLYEQRFLFRFVIINCLRLSACLFCKDLLIFLITILHQYNIFCFIMLLAIKFEAGFFLSWILHIACHIINLKLNSNDYY